MNFSLPWPPKILSPNSRPHWSLKAKAVKRYRTQACLITQTQPQEPLMPSEGLLPIAVVFHPTDNRARDADNCLAAFKSGLDGIADGLGINDKRFRVTFEMGSVIKGGEVEVRI